MSESIIQRKSFDFAVRLTRFYRGFTERKREFVISRQLLRSGTSICANVREAMNSQTKREFVYKLSLSQKECDETLFWLELLYASEYITTSEFESFHPEVTALLKIIRSIILTTKKKHNL